MIPRLVVLLALTVAVLAVGGSRQGSAASSGDHGILETFAPQSATTWWAIVESNLRAKTFVVRTSDGGRRWRDLTPPVELISSSHFLGDKVGWVEAGALFPAKTEPLYRTVDAGRSWQRLAQVPTGCQLDFIDERHGWCAVIGAAAGSSTIRLYLTTDSGSSWELVSRTGLYDTGSTGKALPYACDKMIKFTSPTAGWASSFCNGGSPYLYRSTDGGVRWHALTRVPLPKAAPTAAGEGLSAPVVTGPRLAVAVEISGNPGATAIATSSNMGRSWRTRLVPGALRHWRVDLIDTQRWRLTDGTLLLATDDAGSHWRSWRPTRTMKDSVGAPLTLSFRSPLVGFAVPDANDGPLWWTRDDGKTWQPIRITAGPFTLPSKSR